LRESFKKRAKNKKDGLSGRPVCRCKDTPCKGVCS